MPFKPGQRYVSETEPELGLGTVINVDGRAVHILFPATGAVRQYAGATAPVHRVVFRTGEEIRDADGRTIRIEAVYDEDGLLSYEGQGHTVAEAALSDTIRFVHPEERLLGGHADESRLFELRHETWRHVHRIRRSPVRGFAGARMDLIPHQLYVAHSVASRLQPRVLLSDEVGLGKTIEACLVLHRLVLQGRVKRALVLVPETLVHQWFVELMRRFNMTFAIFDEERCLALEGHDPDGNPFLNDQLILCDMAWLTHTAGRGRQAAAAGWDLVIVDEAHHLSWSENGAGPGYQLVEELARCSPGILLLTATPEQFGEESHFGRLRLLDPDRYPEFEAFLKEAELYHDVASAASALIQGGKLTVKQRELLARFAGQGPAASTLSGAGSLSKTDRERVLADLLDRHGPGRVLFRNTRSAVSGFPGREPHLVPLEGEDDAWRPIVDAEMQMWLDPAEQDPGIWQTLDYAADPRVLWLADTLRKNPDRKYLVLCHDRRQVVALSEGLRTRINVKTALFHEEIPLLQRDRQAAWFAEEDGARILLCSEIGGEGRNFQFAHGLVLFDLPLDPELVEQRIGRLDRIGRSQPIRIYVPYIRSSRQEAVVRWYDEGIEAFSGIIADGNEIRERFGAELQHVCRTWPDGGEEALVALIRKTRKEHDRLHILYREGRDRLLELHSFRPEATADMVSEIREWDGDASLRDFALNLFDHLGVQVEELDTASMLLHPGHLFSDSFSDLPKEGLTVTLSRTQALAREEMGFLTWDHPLVVGGMDLLLRSEQGNSTVAVFEGDAPARLCLEALFVLEPTAPPDLEADRFLPPTPVRVLVSDALEDLSDAFPVGAWNSALRDGRPLRLLDQRDLWRDPLKSMLPFAESTAESLAALLREQALDRMRRVLDREHARMEHLAEVNDHVSRTEVESLEKQRAALDQHLAAASVRLDAVRLVLGRTV